MCVLYGNGNVLGGMGREKKTLLKELLVIYSIQCKYFAKSKMPFVILET